MICFSILLLLQAHNSKGSYRTFAMFCSYNCATKFCLLPSKKFTSERSTYSSFCLFLDICSDPSHSINKVVPPKLGKRKRPSPFDSQKN